MQNVPNGTSIHPGARLNRRSVPHPEDAAQVPDFVDFLSERLSTNRADAMHVLADLLAAYRPARAYPIDVLEPAAERRAG